MAFPKLYKRSIFFEILSVDGNGNADKVQESFAMTIPPTNIEIVQGQRVTITPTPGGNFIDNYGLGNAKISINGETGNEESRFTVLGAGKVSRTLTGQECYFEWRNRIERYSLNKNENYIMRFYDLTHKGSIAVFRQNDLNKRKFFSEAWEVVLTESASMRGAQKPFFYPYRINLEGVRPLGTYDPGKSNNKIELLSNIRDFIDSVTGAVAVFNENLELFAATYYQYVNDVVDIISSVNAFLNELTSFSDLVLEYERKIGGLFTEILSETEDILLSGVQLITFPYDVLETAREQLDDVIDKTTGLATIARQAGLGVLDKYDWDKTVDPISTIEVNSRNIQTPFNTMVLTAKQNASDEPIGAVAINGAVTPIYGYTVYVVQENTRLDKLARDVLGDPDLKDIISSINGLYSNDELIAGTSLLIPILAPITRYSNNAVYNTPDERGDLLGRDAKVVDGVFVTNQEDYALTSREETLYQAVYFRLSEKRERQIRDGSYGIIAEVGAALSDEAPFELLSVSLQETLLQEPRIVDVYDLNLVADGDNVYQEFRFDTITKTAVDYKEGI